MTVIIEKSICVDCDGRNTCQRLKRLNPGISIRDELIQKYESGNEFLCKLVKSRIGRPKEVFEVIIVTCSMKEQQNKRKKFTVRDAVSPLYYCNLCQMMHRDNSELGIAHKRYSGG